MTRARDLLRSGPLWGGLAGAVALGVVAVRVPHAPGSYGTCPWLAATGLPCGGCGGLRATHDLLHGDVTAALGQNALAVALVLVATAFWVRWAWRSVRPSAAPPQENGTSAWADRSSIVLLVLVAVAVAFTLVRWTPLGGALGP